MKKITSLFLVICMIFTLVLTSCNKQDRDKDAESTEEVTTNTKDVETEPPTEKTEPKTPVSVFDEPKNSTKTAATPVAVSQAATQYSATVSGSNATFDPLKCSLFEISGFPYLEQNKTFNRLLLSDASKYSSTVSNLASNTAGGRIRFRTDASTIRITVSLTKAANFAHMTRLGTDGIDIYVGNGTNKKYLKSIQPTGSTSYSADITLSGGLQDYTIILPLYTGVKSIKIAIPTSAKLGTPTPYTYEKPVVFYGSSITQGCSASRPGTNYCEVVTRMLDANLVNLGFSGGAKGEQAIAEYISKLEMSAFVLDYDYNASSASELQSTHYNFYKTVREANPDLPIIIMTKCNVDISDTDWNAERRAVIKGTYDRAVKEGDKNVYFIDGQYVYPEIGRELCTVDGTHPTDIGMYYISQAVYPVLKSVLK